MSGLFVAKVQFRDEPITEFVKSVILCNCCISMGKQRAVLLPVNIFNYLNELLFEENQTK